MIKGSINKNLIEAYIRLIIFHLPATLRRWVTLNNWPFCMLFYLPGLFINEARGIHLMVPGTTRTIKDYTGQVFYFKGGNKLNINHYKKYIDMLTIKDATHKLKCRHAQNSRVGRDYWMECIVLRELPNNRVKLLVFGERYWKGRDHIKYIRYVDKNRIREMY